MKYYRVKPECDNIPKFRYVGKDDFIRRDNYLIGNELYTPRERSRIANGDRFFEVVEISKKKVHIIFGVRFENRE